MTNSDRVPASIPVMMLVLTALMFGVGVAAGPALLRLAHATTAVGFAITGVGLLADRRGAAGARRWQMVGGVIALIGLLGSLALGAAAFVRAGT